MISNFNKLACGSRVAPWRPRAATPGYYLFQTLITDFQFCTIITTSCLFRICKQQANIISCIWRRQQMCKASVFIKKKSAKGNLQLRFSANKNVVASLCRQEALQLITDAWIHARCSCVDSRWEYFYYCGGASDPVLHHKMKVGDAESQRGSHESP